MMWQKNDDGSLSFRGASSKTESQREEELYESTRTKLQFAAAVHKKFPGITVHEAVSRVPEWVEDLLGISLERGCRIRVVSPGDKVPGADLRTFTEEVLAGAAFFGEHDLPVSWRHDDDNVDVRLQSGSLLSRIRHYPVPSKAGFYPNARQFWLCLG